MAMEFYPELTQHSRQLAFTSFSCALATTTFFVIMYRRSRFLFVKPTTMILGLYHVLIQWPFVILSGFLDTFLQSPWPALFLVHGFLLLGLMLSSLTWRNTSVKIWCRLSQPTAAKEPGRILMLLLLAFAVALAAVYINKVPWTQTGLYALIYNPSEYQLAREESLKLLTDPIARWALTLLMNTIAPMLTACVAALLFTRGTANLMKKAVWMIAGVGVAGLAALSGAKGILVFLVLVALLVPFWRNKLSVSFGKVLAAGAVALLPAFLFLMQIASVSDTLDSVWSLEGAAKVAGAIAKRVVIIPAVVGIWYVDYAQSFGPIGIAGIARVAALVGVAPVDLPNLIGLTYGPLYYGHEVVDSISANSGFLFAFYAYFGIYALPVALLALLSCDFALVLVYDLPNNWLAPMLAVVSVSALKFVQSDFLTVWVTHGFGLTIVLAWCIARLLPATTRSLPPLA